MDLQALQEHLVNKGKISFHVKVSPGADKTEWQEALADGTLRLKVKAPPERGQANAAVIVFLAAAFGVNQKSITITAGGGGRLKRIKIVKR